MTHYCHNCRYWSDLVDTVFCATCLHFYHANHRMPRKQDIQDNPTSIDAIYREMGWTTS